MYASKLDFLTPYPNPDKKILTPAYPKPCRVHWQQFLQKKIGNDQCLLNNVYLAGHKYVWNLFMVCPFVFFRALSWRMGLITEVTWNRYSFQMVGLNVISNVNCKTFLPTHFANGGSFQLWPTICLFSMGDHLLPFLLAGWDQHGLALQLL